MRKIVNHLFSRSHLFIYLFLFFMEVAVLVVRKEDKEENTDDIIYCLMLLRRKSLFVDFVLNEIRSSK